MHRRNMKLVSYILFLILSAVSSFALGDNVYCGPGNVPKFGTVDGPAQLPKTCIYTGMDGTPSPGKVLNVSGGFLGVFSCVISSTTFCSLQNALNAAHCGDIV